MRFFVAVYRRAHTVPRTQRGLPCFRPFGSSWQQCLLRKICNQAGPHPFKTGYWKAIVTPQRFSSKTRSGLVLTASRAVVVCLFVCLFVCFCLFPRWTKDTTLQLATLVRNSSACGMYTYGPYSWSAIWKLKVRPTPQFWELRAKTIATN